MHLEKNRSYACTFPVQRRKINVVEVRFTMRYSSRKLSNDKVVTTACNFWRQITCSFQVMSGNILFLGKKIFEISPFFLDLGKKKIHACTLRFSALNLQRILHKDLTRFHSWLQTSLFWLRDVVMRKKEGHCRGWRMTRFLQSLSWVRKNQTSERNALLAGCFSRWTIDNNSQHRGSGNLLAVR